MKLPFSKYHGTGNDFIVIDNRQLLWKPTQRQVAFLCDRHFGIGADGLMLLQEKTGYDFAMVYYNSDGLESTMCGNGGRCMTAFARSLGLTGCMARFSAIDGDHEAEIFDSGTSCIYRLQMKDAAIGKTYDDGIFIDTGSPHFVVFGQNIEQMDVNAAGRILRNDDRFAPGGTNVDFVELQPGRIFVRTYERGVENETLSCGTGVTAVALAIASRDSGNNGSCRVETPGGMLKVSYKQDGGSFSEVWLEGPAKFVFRGEVEVRSEA
jgi:diaminopimelate epimerase